MRNTGKEPYYCWYEDRYREVYTQGVQFWTDDPQEIEKTTESLSRFLAHYGLAPGQSRIIEFGCGEGHLARFLLERGYEYTGVDISASALEKARQRVGRLATGKNFILGDVTSLPEIPRGSFDAAVDNGCLHMLVVDSHRDRYLSEVRRLLASNGKACFRDNYREDAFEGEVSTFSDYLEIFKPDLATPEERTAYSDGDFRKIMLPRLPARARSEAGYCRELSAAGFEVEGFAVEQCTCIIYAG